MSILALDPATKCGFGLLRDDGQIESGVWNLKPDRYQRSGELYIRLNEKLVSICDRHAVTEVVYEKVHRHMGTDAAHIYGGIEAFIMWIAECRGIKYSHLEVGSIKSHATKMGNASKDQMFEAARRRWPDINIIDDNQADALWILDLYCKNRKIPQAVTA